MSYRGRGRLIAFFSAGLVELVQHISYFLFLCSIEIGNKPVFLEQIEIFIAWLPKGHLHLVLPERGFTAFNSFYGIAPTGLEVKDVSGSTSTLGVERNGPLLQIKLFYCPFTITRMNKSVGERILCWFGELRCSQLSPWSEEGPDWCGTRM